MHPDVLTKDEITSVINRQGCRRVPLMIRQWIGGDLYDACGDDLRNFVDTIPEDFLRTGFKSPGKWEGPKDSPEYRWSIRDQPEDDAPKG